MTRSTSSARAAANRAASAHGETSSPCRRTRRIRSPSGVPPGSRVATTSRPSFRSRCSSSRAWVVLPEPSRPSKVTKIEVANIGGRRIERVRAIVTGGAGFIGSHLVEALVERGDDVLVVDDLSRGKREQVPGEVELVQQDVREPLDEVFAR